MCISFHLLFIDWTFQNSASLKNNKETLKLVVIWRRRLLPFIWFFRNSYILKCHHISRIYSQISCKIFSFEKVIIILMWTTHTAWKVSVFGVILVRISPHLGWIWRDTERYSVRMPQNTDQNISEYGQVLRGDGFYFPCDFRKRPLP